MNDKWSMYDEAEWLDFIIERHINMTAHFLALRHENNARIERWENYLRTGK